ncbi:MAG TPA: hypothetical protein VF028_08005 [Actinomycetota bacterium]|jgi:hypothetical protein|nr:hypothetical protein [Actinomycetota bacterium]
MSDAIEAIGSALGNVLPGARRAGVAYVIWGGLHDLELDDARAAMASLTEDEALRHEAAMRRTEKLRAIASEATFFSGLARVDGEFRSILVAVTAQDFVLLDNWNHDPEAEFARLPRESITHAVIVDEDGLEVADALIDPIRELETSQEERYAVVLKRHDRSGELSPVSFLFRSGEPAVECRDRYRRFIGEPA